MLLVIYPHEVPRFDAEVLSPRQSHGVARPESQGLCPRARSQMWSARPVTHRWDRCATVAMAAAKQGILPHETGNSAMKNRELEE